MIKKSVFENELIAGMERQLVLSAEADGINGLEQAVEYIHSAIETFEEAGMTAQADALLQILSKIATKHKPKKKDKATEGLTSEKMIENLLNHGTEFNLLDDTNINDLLEADIGDANLEVSEMGNHQEMDFEDEI